MARATAASAAAQAGWQLSFSHRDGASLPWSLRRSPSQSLALPVAAGPGSAAATLSPSQAAEPERCRRLSDGAAMAGRGPGDSRAESGGANKLGLHHFN